ncbi:MAG: hypothetical protein AAFY01_04285 [Pseudomonadota bacterium]
MTFVATRLTQTHFSGSKGLTLAAMVLVMAAGLATRAEAQSQVRASTIFPQPSTLSITPEVGERMTVAKYKPMVTETLGPSQGARLLGSGERSSLFSTRRFPEGLVLHRFGGENRRYFCVHSDTPGNTVSKESCLIDRDQDGMFDESARLWGPGDWFDSEMTGDLEAPIPYEIVELDDPSFKLEMRVSYGGIKDGNIALSATGFRTKGARDLEDNLGAPERTTIAPFTGDRAITIEGISLMLHEVTEDSITFTYLGGNFTRAHFLDMNTLQTVYYGR